MKSNQYYTNNHIVRSILRNHNSSIKGLAHWYNPLQWQFMLEVPLSKILKAKLQLLVLSYKQKETLRTIQYKQDVKKSRLRLVA